MPFPTVLDTQLVGTYGAVAKAGGGYVWDEVLEYRVWCHLEHGAPDEADGSDYYYAFAFYEDAAEFALSKPRTEEPLALILQREHIDEPEDGHYVHVREERVAEWPVEFLARPRRTEQTIPAFMAPDAPLNRLAILRGQA
ncbi:MAG: GCN5 family acetyltransferase [Ideonella sp.]|nr:GCN5 family acetyltransferase [Ideonella sp.]